MGPACADISGVRAGDRNLMTATITSKGSPVNLTGYTLMAHAKVKNTDATPALVAVITVVDAVAGSITLRWPGDDVRTLLAGKPTWAGVWDMQIDNGVEDPVTVVTGKFRAELDVTR